MYIKGFWSIESVTISTMSQVLYTALYKRVIPSFPWFPLLLLMALLTASSTLVYLLLLDKCIFLDQFNFFFSSSTLPHKLLGCFLKPLVKFLWTQGMSDRWCWRKIYLVCLECLKNNLNKWFSLLTSWSITEFDVG